MKKILIKYVYENKYDPHSCIKPQNPFTDSVCI